MPISFLQRRKIRNQNVKLKSLYTQGDCNKGFKRGVCTIKGAGTCRTSFGLSNQLSTTEACTTAPLSFHLLLLCSDSSPGSVVGGPTELRVQVWGPWKTDFISSITTTSLRSYLFGANYQLEGAQPLAQSTTLQPLDANTAANTLQKMRGYWWIHPTAAALSKCK